MKFRIALFVSAASGFIALSYEIFWYRLYAFVSRGSPLTFGLLLGFYLIGIAFGSYRSRRYCEGTSAVVAQQALGRFLFLANAAAFLVAPAMSYLVTVAPWPASVAFVAVATTLLGAVLPLTSHLAIAPDDRAGASLSYLYLANILGSCAGSLLTGFLAMEYLGTRSLAVGLAWLGFLLAGAVVFATEAEGMRRRVGLSVVALGALVSLAMSHAVFDQLYERLLFQDGFTKGMHFAETVENRSGIVHAGADGRVFGGGVYDGAFNTSLVQDKNWVVRAFAVSALHPMPKRMLMVGLASGSWAKILAAAPGLDHLTVIEINPGYLELIAHHVEVSGILTDPKVEIVIDDGRRWLEAHPNESFDAIVMNTTWHQREHSTNLLSREFIEIVKHHLTPGGLYFFNATQSRDACKTTQVEFAHTYRVINFVAGSDAPLSIDPTAWRSILLAYRIDGRPVLDESVDADRDALARLVAFAKPGDWSAKVEEDTSLRLACREGEVITDDNMLPEWREITHREME